MGANRVYNFRRNSHVHGDPWPSRAVGVSMILVSKERSMNAHERPIITEDNKTAVRAGSTGNNVRYVLIGSVALAILAWILVEYFVRP
jgi:hypothetical protein